MCDTTNKSANSISAESEFRPLDYHNKSSPLIEEKKEPQLINSIS